MSNAIVGDAKKFSAKFFNLFGVQTDPDTVTLEVKDPEGTVTLFTLVDLVKESDGYYSKIVSFDSPGNWYIEWQSTGAVQKVAYSRIYVKPQKITQP